MTETGRDYELIVKAIYEALLKQNDLNNLRIEQGYELIGSKAKHKVDVYWEFSIAGEIYKTIVEVKKKKGRAKKSELATLDWILKDVPGQPKGIFVSQSGYQRGALDIARAAGITLIQLVKIPDNFSSPKIELTNISIMKCKIIPERLLMQTTAFNTEVKDIKVEIDSSWNEYRRIASGSNSLQIKADPGKVIFCDEHGAEKFTFRKIIQEFLSNLHSGGSFPIEFDFNGPTFMTGFEILNENDYQVDRIMVKRIAANLHVQKTVSVSPMMSEGIATYLMEYTFERESRYILIKDSANKPQAIVEIARRLHSIQR